MRASMHDSGSLRMQRGAFTIRLRVIDNLCASVISDGICRLAPISGAAFAVAFFASNVLLLVLLSAVCRPTFFVPMAATLKETVFFQVSYGRL
jgi:hypothetical protein